MNGGTTFLIRAAKEYDRRGQRCAVLLLTPRYDPALREELECYAAVVELAAILRDRGALAQGLLGVFAPLNWKAVRRELGPFGPHVHAMGIFALVLGTRFAKKSPVYRVSLGIYHQNEFIFRGFTSYFADKVTAMFRALPPANTVFFNESSRKNYIAHFEKPELKKSTILPIGIELDHPPVPRAQAGYNIVSVGNLVGFKTYNRHMIEIVSQLRENLPRIRYSIYGSGPEEESLKALAAERNVSDCVRFHGNLHYENFRKVIAGCDVFVGSGTALLEAAAVGRPALIGIESNQEPSSYGFLSDIEGFSYNENNPSRPKSRMADLIATVLCDPDRWETVAQACYRKAREFSIAATVDGLEAVGATAEPLISPPGPLTLMGMAASAIRMKIGELVKGNEAFGDRRDQSY